MDPITQPTHFPSHRPPSRSRFDFVPLGISSRPWLAALLRWALLLVVCVPALTLRLSEYPPIWFDEGGRTNEARTLAVMGVYGTYTSDGPIPYDVGISSGPADIVPLALAYRLLGPGIAQSRLTGALYALLAVGALYTLSRSLFGETDGLLSVLVVLAFPPIRGVSLLLIGRQIMGETPALALATLGLWLWFKSWGRRDWRLAVLSGLSIGLGLLSKTQVAFGLLPAMALIAWLRGRRGDRLSFSSVPLLGALLTIAGWQTWTWLTSTPEVRVRNAQMLAEAIRAQLLTGLWGRHLDRSALVILTLMLVAVAGGTWLVLHRRRGSGVLTDQDWGLATLVLFVFFSAIWFGFFSIGWPRYATVGHIVGILLLGKLASDVFHAATSRLGGNRAGWSRWLSAAGAVALGLVALGITLEPILRFQDLSQAQRAADFVSANIPQNAVVESWAWELDALTNHWRFHHPDLSYLYLAVRQEFHDQVPFALNYDTLQADPDYLISGPFSQWTRLYDPQVVQTSFRKLATIGQYVIFERIR